MPDYINEGVKEVLFESVAIIEKANILDYIVIGGWCPYLRNNENISGLKHPGTRDVDILFRFGYESGKLSNAIEELLSAGFIPSSKHPFQFLKIKRIKNKKLMFNIDLLHPRMSSNERWGDLEMFSDHLDLDILFSPEESERLMGRSIALPGSMVLFDDNLYNSYSLDGHAFNLIDFTGLVLTKMKSWGNIKRPRDSFDIYVAFKNEAVDCNKLLSYSNEYKNYDIGDETSDFISSLHSKSHRFDMNVSQYAKVAEPSPAQYVLECLNAL